MSDPCEMTREMNVWLRVVRGLTTLEAVHRLWARQLGLEGMETYVLMALEEHPASGARVASEIARDRQQAQRTLRGLRARGLVEPCEVSDGGKTQSWALTNAGVECVRRLRARARAWEEMMAPVLSMADLAAQLAQLEGALVNQPFGNGWAHALHEPFEAHRNPRWDQLPFKMARLEQSEPDADPAQASRPRDEMSSADATGGAEGLEGSRAGSQC